MQEAAGIAAHYMYTHWHTTCAISHASASALGVIITLYTRFMEDDFEVCANGLLALQYAVAKAYAYQPDWTSIRFG